MMKTVLDTHQEAAKCRVENGSSLQATKSALICERKPRIKSVVKNLFVLLLKNTGLLFWLELEEHNKQNVLFHRISVSVKVPCKQNICISESPLYTEYLSQ